MTMTDNSVFLSKNFLEFVVSGNYLLQESIRTLAAELKEKIGIKLPEELKLYQDTEIELKQKLGLKLFQDVEQEVEDEFPNRKEYSWSGGDVQRGVNFNKATENRTLQICKAASVVYLVDLRLKKDLFLKEQALLPTSISTAVETRVEEVTRQIKEKLDDIELDEIWKEMIRYHFRDHFHSVQDVLATLDRAQTTAPHALSPVPAQTNLPAQMTVPRPTEEEYQLYQPRIAPQSVPPKRPQVVPAFPLPPLIKKGDDFFADVLSFKTPILVGLAFFVGTIGFFILNPFGQNSVSTVVPSASIPAELVSPTSNSTAIESSVMPTDALRSANPSASTANEKSAVVVPLAIPTKTPLVQASSPAASSKAISKRTLASAPWRSRYSQRRFYSRRHKSRHGSRYHAKR